MRTILSGQIWAFSPALRYTLAGSRRKTDAQTHRHVLIPTPEVADERMPFFCVEEVFPDASTTLSAFLSTLARRIRRRNHCGSTPVVCLLSPFEAHDPRGRISQDSPSTKPQPSQREHRQRPTGSQRQQAVPSGLAPPALFPGCRRCWMGREPRAIYGSARTEQFYATRLMIVRPRMGKVTFHLRHVFV